MAALDELVNQIPGIDPEVLIYVSKPFKPTTCDPVVITDVTQNTKKYCAPTTISADVKAAALEAKIGETQKMLGNLNFSTPNQYGDNVIPTSPYNNDCSALYVKTITDIINTDIIPKNNASQENVKNLPVYTAEFWNGMMVYVYNYTISHKLLNDGMINNDDFKYITNILSIPDTSDIISSTYKNNISIIKSNIESSISSTDIVSYISNPLTIPDILVSGASDIGKQFDNRMSANLDNHKLLSYSINTKNLESGITFEFSNIFQKPTDDQIQKGNVKPTADLLLLQKAFDIFNSSIKDIVKYAAIVYFYGKYTSFNWIDSVRQMRSHITPLNRNYNSILSAYDSMDGSKMEQYVKNKITSIKACGQKVPDTTNIDEPDTSTKNVNHKTYSKIGQPDFTELKYWKTYSKIINTIGLLPQYWRVGLLIPTPAGILKVPVPIIWKPLIVIPTPLSLIVIFITIDGMIVSPVIWTLIQKPVANAESKFLVLFRGANKSIKTDTGVKMLNLPVVNGEDVDPGLSRTLPFEKDDLPAIERVSITNPLLLVYINKWLLTATQYLGIP